VRPGTTIIRVEDSEITGTTISRVEDSEINYLLTHCVFGVAVPRRCLAKTPAICGPFEEYVLPQHLLSGRVR